MGSHLSDTFRGTDGSPPQVGRDRELQELQSAFDLASRGYGSVVVVSGEAGIGKSTLVSALSDTVRLHGGTVLTGHCYDLTDLRPYGPWHEAFASAGPGTVLPALIRILGEGDRPSHPGIQTELFEPIADALRSIADHDVLMILIEDVQWADSASLDLLRYIGRHAATSRLLIVVTYRDDHHDPQHPALHLMPHLVREGKARRIELHPLTLEQVRELIDALYSMAVNEAQSLVDYLYTRAEGNPFFTLELLRDLELKGVLKVEDGQWHLEPLPEMPVPVVVRQIIESRLRWLDDANFALLDIASIIGQEVPIDLWQDVSGADDDEIISAVEQARDLHIASETPDRHHIRFTHGLIRETFYRSKSAMRRRKHHRKVAEALISRADPAPGLVAHHFALGDDPRAVSWLIQAGEHAARMYAAEDAISYFTEALAQASHHQQATPIPALRGRAHGYEVLGKFDLALRDLTEIRSAADRTEDRNAEWRALLDLGMLWTGKDYQQAGIRFNEAYDMARALDDQAKIAHSINRIANWNVNTGQSKLPDIIAKHQEALSIFEAAGDKTGIADTLDLLGMTCYLAGRFGLSAEYETRAIALSRKMDDKARLLTSLTALAVNGGDLDVSFDAGVSASKDSQFWVGCAEEALAISRQTGWKSDQAFTLTMLASLVSVRGDPGRGLRLANEAQEIATRIGHQQWISASALVLGRIWAELLDYQRAEYYLERCRASSESAGSYFWTVFAMSALANLHAEAGRIDLAGRFLEPYISSEGTGKSNTQRSFQLSLGSWRLAAGEAEEALKIADSLIALEEGSPLIKGVPQVLKLRADTLCQLDRLSEAGQAYLDALEAAELLAYRSVLWKIHIGHGALLRKQGQHSDAEDAFRSAEMAANEIAETIDDRTTRTQFQAQVQQRIGIAMGTDDHRADTGGLSSRQLEVLSLVALGLTDAQVAERLYISPRTVARHLQSIYDRLGVNSRTAAVTVAYQRNLIRPPVAS